MEISGDEDGGTASGISDPNLSEGEADHAGAEQEAGTEPEMSEASETDRKQGGEGEEISAEPILRDSTAGKNLAVSGSDLPVSDNVLREPEDFHETPAPEAYGELASYDAYSRTYRTGDNSFVTVIGTDGATYLDEAGRLRQIDNTLTENPVRPILSIGRHGD